MEAKLKINLSEAISKIDKRIYGSFIEHLGRAVYGGIYEPAHETADDMGFRGDVMKLVKQLDVPIVRYPGGNFVSGYNWEDGTGDKSKRPKKLDLAWNSIETNEFGTDEFQEWAKRAGTEVMMAVNLGTRGPDEARNFVEYCNSNTDTYYADMRRKNGFNDPFGVKLWCLGNEMDGHWQIGAKTATEYARAAHETAKVMKLVDPSIELVACGSSSKYMPTFGEWERTVLRECYDNVDYLSLHSYYGNHDGDTKKFLASSVFMEEFICEVVKICDEIKAEKGSDKEINLSFDEWNIWFHSNEQDKEIPSWQIAPPLLEDVYTFEDALVLGCLMITLLRHSDRVKIACLAQLVNVIAPIMTQTGGSAIAQTIYYPFMYTSKYGRGSAVEIGIDCETYDCEGRSVPFVDAIGVVSDDGKEFTVFAVNRSLYCDICPEITFAGEGHAKLIEHIELHDDDLNASNTFQCPDRIAPNSCADGEAVVLKARSWNMLRYSITD